MLREDQITVIRPVVAAFVIGQCHVHIRHVIHHRGKDVRVPLRGMRRKPSAEMRFPQNRALSAPERPRSSIGTDRNRPR